MAMRVLRNANVLLFKVANFMSADTVLAKFKMALIIKFKNKIGKSDEFLKGPYVTFILPPHHYLPDSLVCNLAKQY